MSPMSERRNYWKTQKDLMESEVTEIPDEHPLVIVCHTSKVLLYMHELVP